MIAIFLIILLPGCGSSSYCISAGGSSDKYGFDDANVEFCYNAKLSEEEGAVVLVSPRGEEHYLVHKKYIHRANDIIEKARNSSMKATNVTEDKRKQTKAMKKFIDLTK